ncbi:protein FLX-like 2 isoform X1 [Bidens hawaiensis]|uniref:protein FLX-like 2 isoform X1 n=1 Tax=Bidens hawaiensis TaxID=980011 RepID=UPI004048F478
MTSKGRLPPPHHLRHPLPGPGMGHRDPIPPDMQPHRGGFPPYDMPPHPEIMEQKIAAQHMEMQKLATENRRFATTHGTLRQDLATVQHELQMLHNHVGAVKAEREQQIMGLLERNGKMEADLQGAEPLKMELNKARAEAQGLLAARDELLSRVQKLTEDHQRVHMDLQQIPALMAELEGLRQEYQHCRQTYEYEKKLYNEHLESLQVMEKNYMTMAGEVEKLRAELKKQAEIDKRTAAAAPYPVGHNTYDDAYAVNQGRGPLPGSGAPAYDPQRGPGFHKGPGAPAYDPQRVPGAAAYDPQWGPGAPAYDPQRGPGAPGYDPHRGAGYDMYRGPGGTGYDRQWGPGGPARGPQFGGPGYEAHRGTNFESPTGPAGPQGQAMQQASDTGYGSVAATTHGGGGYQGAQVQAPQAPADGRR